MAPRLTMSVSMQGRVSFSNEKAVGVDDISSEVLKALPWSAVQKTKGAFERRYLGDNKEKNPTSKSFFGFVFRAKWYCRCFTILMDI